MKHILEVTSRDAEDTRRNPKIRPFDASCRCGDWSVSADTREEYRALHRVHLEGLERAA
jgi:hypothetical protein